MTTTENTYKPKPQPMRPGSQDAFAKPSLEGEVRVPYTGPKSGCVGVLKDRRQHHNNY